MCRSKTDSDVSVVVGSACCFGAVIAVVAVSDVVVEVGRGFAVVLVGVVAVGRTTVDVAFVVATTRECFKA